MDKRNSYEENVWYAGYDCGQAALQPRGVFHSAADWQSGPADVQHR